MPSRIPIGLPISGTTVYVMQGERICGVGVPGELHWWCRFSKRLFKST